MKKIAFFFFVITSASLIFSCANEVAPTGGPKDTNPPKVMRNTPDNYSVAFNASSVTFEFDEYIRLNNIKQKLMVSPPLDKDPTFIQKGKKLIMKINSKLKNDVTYNFFFDDAIVDLNEGNAIKNFSFIFSTGNYLDSLYLKGSVADALSLNPSENMLVMLYIDKSDSAFISQKPYYVTKSDKNGNFAFTHLKDTTYKIFALKDLNSSYTYDLITENLAFYDSAFHVNDNSSFSLFSFQAVDTVQKILEKKTTALNTIQLVSLLPFTNPKIEFYKYIPDFWRLACSNSMDSITIFTSGIDTAFFTVYDEENFIDSVKVVVKTQKFLNNAALNITSGFNNKTYYKDTLLLYFNGFIKEMFCDSIKIISIRDSIVDTTYAKLILVEPENISARINFNPDSKIKYMFAVPDSAFMDINGLFNKSISFTATMLDDDAFGNIILNFKKIITANNTLPDDGKITHLYPSDCSSFLVEILKSDNIVVAKQCFVLPHLDDSIELKFTKLLPGEYSLRVIYDIDNNCKWTTGNYHKKRQPEKVIYPKKLTAIAKWDTEEFIEIPF